jgi:hypothetical protein
MCVGAYWCPLFVFVVWFGFVLWFCAVARFWLRARSLIFSLGSQVPVQFVVEIAFTCSIAQDRVIMICLYIYACSCIVLTSCLCRCCQRLLLFVEGWFDWAWLFGLLAPSWIVYYRPTKPPKYLFQIVIAATSINYRWF